MTALEETRTPAAVPADRTRRRPPEPGGRGAALVLGGDYQGLGIARSLARHGVRVAVLDDERSPAAHSRHVAHALRVDDLHDDAATLAAVDAATRRFGLEGCALFPTRDETVALFARHRDELGERFRVSAPSWSAVRACWDKRETYRLAARLGIDHPRTWVPEAGADVADVTTPGPFLIKPAIKEHFFYATGVKGWRIADAADLPAAVDRATAIAGPGEILVQEMLPGDGAEQFSYCALVAGGRPVAEMTVGRRRQHPSDLGRASTYVETLDRPEIVEPSTRFLAALDYDGLVEIEYKRDPRDGSYRLLDVNARTWGYHSLGAAAGVDFPWLQYRALVGAGHPEVPVRARPGVRWLRVATDLPNALRDVLAGDVRLGRYLATLPRTHVEAVGSLRDPWPGLHELALLPYLAVKRGL